MTAAICTGSSACKSVALGKTGNNPYTYNCDELYMASPLEKKQRTGSVNYHTEYGLPCVVLWFRLDNEKLLGRVLRRTGSKVRRVTKRKEGVQIGLSLNSANRGGKKDRLFMLSSVCKNC